jgi:hypothetical protein
MIEKDIEIKILLVIKIISNSLLILDILYMIFLIILNKNYII